MSERFTYPKPAKPQIVRDLDAIRRETARDMRAGLTGNLASLASFTGHVYAASLMQALTDEERAEVAEYSRQVAAYNAQVEAYNRRQREAKAQAQAQAQAAKATAQVRAARCGQCFTVHGKGQIECW